MQPATNEGIRRVNNIPLSLECLIQSHDHVQRASRTHYHDYIELLYVLEGQYEVWHNGVIHLLPKGGMFIIHPGEPHSTQAPGCRQCLLCIKFLPQILFSAEPSVTELEYSVPYVFEQFSGQRQFSPALLSTTLIPGAFEAIYEEKVGENFGYELAIRAQVQRIFLWIIRYWHQQAGSPDLVPSTPSAAAALYNAREYVKQHYADASLAEAARACNLSYGHFSRLFNAYMKMSFSDYVNRERIRHSSRLLASTDLSVTEIALAVGFSTTSYYIQVFKKLQGISPLQFRKRARTSGAAAE